MDKTVKIVLWILGGFMTILIGIQAYKLIKNAPQDANLLADAVHDSAQDTTIGNSTGVPSNRVNDVRAIAKDLATELETRKDMTWVEKAENIIFDDDLLTILSRVKSSDEMKLTGNFYSNIFTNNADLNTDLKSELSSSNYASVKFIEAIY